MAKIPTPEEIAKILLDIFVSDFKLRAGESLMEKNFWKALQNRDLRPEDLKSGMEYAIQKGWMEASCDPPLGQWFKLTDDGFAAA